GKRVAYMNQFASEMLAHGLTIAEQFKAAAAVAPPQFSCMDMLVEFGLGLQNRGNAFVGHLSGGERQIIALLCTLAAGAAILCLDEFTSALDEKSAYIADRLLEYVKRTSKVALVVVSHSGPLVQIDREIRMTG
ncbi:MAG TPA: hypothetical protein VF756_06305, partial [Thermoanaerobaculia bacterium]